tara:strand:- start:792 stop:1193 length:402 start_codon:yes stop_codon:yes gene_type:complete
MSITVTISETLTTVTVDESQLQVVLNQSDNPITVSTTSDLTLVASLAEDVTYSATTTLPGGNVQEALADLAEQFFKQSATPSGSNLEEGDLWYDTANEELFVYRQVTGGYEWHVIASAGGSSATAFTLDGGSF